MSGPRVGNVSGRLPIGSSKGGVFRSSIGRMGTPISGRGQKRWQSVHMMRDIDLGVHKGGDFTAKMGKVADSLISYVHKIVMDCSDRTLEVPLVRMQGGLRDLGVHTQLLLILDSLYQGGHPPWAGPVMQLASEAFFLLSKFAYNNTGNAALLYPSLDLFLSFLADDNGLEFRVDECVSAMFYGNRALCTQASQPVERKVVSKICSHGQYYPYLKLLEAMMRPHGVAVKRNQARIMRLLDAQREKTLPTYEGAQGLALLRLLMVQQEHRGLDHAAAPGKQDVRSSLTGSTAKQHGAQGEGEEYGDEPPPAEEDGVANPYPHHGSRVLYFLFAVRLYTSACSGTNRVTEQICVRLLPLDRCADLITARWCVPAVKTAVLEFVLEAYILVEQQGIAEKEKLLGSEASWMMIDYFTFVLRRLTKVGSFKAFCTPREHPMWTTRIVAAYLQVCKAFFQRLFRIKRATQDQIRIANSLCDALVQYWGEGDKLPEEQRVVADVLQVMDQRKVTGSDGTRRLLKTLLQAANMNVAVRGEKHDKGGSSLATKVLGLLPSFRANFRARIGLESELDDMVRVCREHPRAVSVITQQLTAADADRSLKRKYIRVLQVLWETLNRDLKVEESMTAVGIDVVVAAILRLVSHGVGDEVQGALNLANSLLLQGGAKVQGKFFDALNRPTAEGFLRELHVRLEIAGDEVREAKAIVQQVVMNSKPVAGRKKTLHQLMDEAHMGDAEFGDAGNGSEPGGGALGVDRSFVNEVMALLKNLCEGHYLPMQDLLRIQPSCEHSVDLVTSVAVFVTELEGSISPLNVATARQAFETLTEFIQGPCRGNVHAMLKTQLGESINRIVTQSSDKLDDRVFYPAEFFHQIRCLKLEVATCIQAMLEAASVLETRVPLILLRSLDIASMVDYSISMFNLWTHARERQRSAGLDVEDRHLNDINAVTIQTGFRYYVLLRTIADFESEPNAALEKLFDTSIPAIVHYEKGTGCLEIAKDRKNDVPDLLRIYFQMPVICNRITQDMKNAILWGVDRRDDVTRLRDFFSRVDDLYLDMKYQQWLNRNTVTVLIRKIGTFADYIYLFNVILMNVLLLVFFRWRDELQSDAMATWNELQHVQLNGAEKSVLQNALPTIQLILEGVMLVNYTISKVPDFVRKRFKTEFYEKLEEQGGNTSATFDFNALPRNLSFFLNYARHALADDKITEGQCFFWRLFTFLLSLSINSSTNDVNQIPLLLYCFLLWEVFPRSKQIGFVLRAVLMGGRALLSLAGMLVIFTYWFGSIGFLFFPDKFQFRRAEVIDGNTVQNDVLTGFGNNRAVPLQYVWQGMLMVIDQGLRKEDVGEALDKLAWPLPCPDPAMYGCAPCPTKSYQCTFSDCDDPRWIEKITNAYSDLSTCGDVFTEWPSSKIFIRVAYTFFFFVMVVAVALEIVFGVIVDSFKKLREEREETLKDIRYKCFTCGINRNLFDSAAPGGFEFHIKNEHNMWIYMYYLIHIREIEDKSMLNGVESYVHTKCINRDVSFFPVGRAICLDRVGAGNAERMMAIEKENVVVKIEQQHSRLIQQVEGQVGHLMAVYNIANDGTAAGAAGRGGSSSVLDKPQVVTEVARRTQIRKAYSPLEVFVMPDDIAAQLSGGPGTDISRVSGMGGDSGYFDVPSPGAAGGMTHRVDSV